MKRSMTRWTLAGCLALTAISAVAVFDVGSTTAEAAPSASPFAGSYVGADPRVNPYAGAWDPADPRGWYSYYSSWPVTISDGGRITSSIANAYGALGDYSKGSINGRVSADGSYSFTVSVTRPIVYENRRPRGEQKFDTRSYQTTGTMVTDPDGNIVGTPDTGGPTGGTFVWLRQ